MGALLDPEPTGHRDAVFGWWEEDGRVLLVRNPRTVGGTRQDLWDLPGGSVRPGETLAAALEREWREEVGLPLTVGDLLLVADGAKRRVPRAPPLYTWRAFVFRASSSGEPRPGEGIVEVAWVPRPLAAARLDAPYHAPLRAWAEGRGGAYDRVDWIDPGAGDPDGRGAGETTRAADRLRRLLAVAACAAAGRGDLLRGEVAGAVADGVARERIEEALLQIVPYAGFPRTIAAFATARPLLGAHAPAPRPTDCRTGGPETFAGVYGETADRVRAGLRSLHPDLEAWTLAFAYGRVLARDGLPLLERELLAVAILTALGRLDDPLLGHMRAAVRLGATPGDVAATIAAVPHALGEDHRAAARALLPRL